MNSLREFTQRYLIPDAAQLSPAERWRSTLAALIGMLLIQGILAVIPAQPGISYLLAPLGATSVILFVLPHSPLAQPWPLVGGLLLPAIIGLLCGTWIQPAFLAVAIALALAIWVTAWLRCIHPPGGAMAVVFALAASQQPVSLVTALLNVGAVLIAVLVVNNIIPGRHYPQFAPKTPATPTPRTQRGSIRHEDLQYALEKIDTYLDISEEDLVRVYDLATNHAHQRHEQRICAEIMTTEVVSVEFGTELNEAWTLLQNHKLHGLPVVDRSKRVIGLLTLDNFLRHVKPEVDQGIGDNIRRLLRPTPSAYSDKPEVVGQIMSERFTVVRSADSISQTVSLLAASNHPVILPVIDENERLAGVISQTDLLAAIYQKQAATAARY
jgi:CBS domain-containing membrane protein